MRDLVLDRRDLLFGAMIGCGRFIIWDREG
jgi:hypothetical protein